MYSEAVFFLQQWENPEEVPIDQLTDEISKIFVFVFALDQGIELNES